MVMLGCRSGPDDTVTYQFPKAHAFTPLCLRGVGIVKLCLPQDFGTRHPYSMGVGLLGVCVAEAGPKTRCVFWERLGVSNRSDVCHPELCLPSRSPPPPSLFPCEVRESKEASPYLPSDYKDQTTKMKENRNEGENLRIYLHGC